jgi:hypothetical protein
MFRLNPDEVITDVPVSSSKASVNDESDEIDDVEIEDITDEEGQTYTNEKNEDLPDIADFFAQQSDEVLERVIEEKEKDDAGPSADEMADMLELKKEWHRAYAEARMKYAPVTPTKFRKVYRLQGKLAKGRIISWAYFHDLNCYAVKRERGIDYVKHPHEFKTFPSFEINQLVYMKLLYSESYGMAKWLENQLKYEYRTKWINLKPQQSKRYFHETELHPITKKPLVILKWKRPKVMKTIPLRKMPQDFSEHFKWWYYDGRTGEAVIVLCKAGSWETIRVYDPMWLCNLSKKDVDTLRKCQLFFEMDDMEQALQFKDVIRFCYGFELSSGVSWKEKAKKFMS